MMRRCVVCLFVLAATASAQDMPLSQVLISGEGWRAVEGKSNVTCVAADGEGKLYIAHSDAGGIDTLWKGKRAPFSKSKWTVTAMGWEPNGSLLTLTGNSLSRQTPGAEAKEIRSDVYGFALSPKGGIYFTKRGRGPGRFPEMVRRDLETGSLVPVGRPGPEVFLLGQDKPVAEGLVRPTALAFWRDGGTLVVGESDGDELYTYRVGKDGSLDAKETYYTLRTRRREPSLVTALVLDADGRLYAATAEGVQVFDPTGRMCGVINAPARAAVTSLAFAGPARDQMYVVCDGKLYTRKTKVKGFLATAKKAK